MWTRYAITSGWAQGIRRWVAAVLATGLLFPVPIQAQTLGGPGVPGPVREHVHHVPEVGLDVVGDRPVDLRLAFPRVLDRQEHEGRLNRRLSYLHWNR